MNLENPFEAQKEPEVMAARRAFPVAQELLGGEASRTVAREVSLGWIGSGAHPETGSIAVVRADGGYADLVGEVLRITVARSIVERKVFAYVVGFSALIDEDAAISVSRRVFLSLAPLWRRTTTVNVEAL